MKKITHTTPFLFSALISALFSACASILNTPTTQVHINSTQNPTLFRIYQDTIWHQTPLLIETPRSSHDLLLVVKQNNRDTIVQIAKKLSNAYKWGNLLTPYYVGYLIDLVSEKRYTYPDKIVITFDSTVKDSSHKQAIAPTATIESPGIEFSKKRQVNVKLALPEGNHFYLNKGTGYGNSFGFLGIECGLEYYLSNQYSISADAGAALDFVIPFPASVHYRGPHSHIMAQYADIEIGRDFGRFRCSGGLNVTHTEYRYIDTLPLQKIENASTYYNNEIQTIQTINNTMGLSLSAYARASNIVAFGLHYYPSFIVFDSKNPQLHYTHLIMFNITFRIPVYRCTN